MMEELEKKSKSKYSNINRLNNKGFTIGPYTDAGALKEIQKFVAEKCTEDDDDDGEEDEDGDDLNNNINNKNNNMNINEDMIRQMQINQYLAQEKGDENENENNINNNKNKDNNNKQINDNSMQNEEED